MATENRGRRASMALQVLGAAALAVWRLKSPLWHPVWEDTLFLLAGYWVFCLFGRDSRAWPPVTGLLGATLGAIYLKTQIPHMLVVYDLLP